MSKIYKLLLLDASEIFMNKYFGAAILSLISSASLAAGLVTDDPTMRPYQETTSIYYNKCASRDGSNVEISSCLFDQYKFLLKRVQAEYKKKIIDVETITDNEKIGGGSPAEIAKKNKTEVIKAQSAWKNYVEALCGSIAQRAERNGANGSGPAVAMGSCYVRATVARLNELTRGDE